MDLPFTSQNMTCHSGGLWNGTIECKPGGTFRLNWYSKSYLLGPCGSQRRASFPSFISIHDHNPLPQTVTSVTLRMTSLIPHVPCQNQMSVARAHPFWGNLKVCEVSWGEKWIRKYLYLPCSVIKITLSWKDDSKLLKGSVLLPKWLFPQNITMSTLYLLHTSLTIKTESAVVHVWPDTGQRNTWQALPRIVLVRGAEGIISGII